MRNLLSLAIVLTASGSFPCFAQDVDLALSPTLQYVEVGDTVRIELYGLASGLSNVEFSAIDALLDYDPAFLKLVGVDDAGAAETWFVSSFLPDPDGINLSISDGNALYTALSDPSMAATAVPAGSLVTTLEFVALAETLGTPVTFLPTLGLFGSTNVYSYAQAGQLVTGDIDSTAIVRVVEPPTQYCLGEPASCPCGNTGGLGVGCRNSTGFGASLISTGTTSVSADDLVLHTAGAPSSTFGIFVVGGGAINQPFGDGLFCVSPGPSGLHRFSPPNHITPFGTMSRGPGLVAYTLGFPSGQEIQVGNTYYFQAWYRDNLGPCGFGWNLTNGLEVTFTP